MKPKDKGVERLQLSLFDAANYVKTDADVVEFLGASFNDAAACSIRHPWW